MHIVVVRFGDIGSKSAQVRGKMVKILRQRIEDRLKYEEIDYDKVSKKPARIIIETEEKSKACSHVKQIPGVSSCSPAYRSEPSIKSIKSVIDELDVGKTFGVETNRSGDHEFNSMDVNEQIGSYIQNKFNSKVDLKNPETWIKIDLRQDEAYIFTEKIKGPDGFPVGSQNDLICLISGGIDSPVAAYQVMTRGANITPIYFYNKPIAAEDHLLRFEQVLNELEKFNPSKKWYYYVIDMESVNQKLMNIGSGRMIVHRRIMFKVAEKIAEKEDLKGIVTGESLGQKSSQTLDNLAITSNAAEKQIYRPLLTKSKKEITGMAREINTFEKSEINSACRSLSPDNPTTKIDETKLDNLETELEVDKLVQEALSTVEKKVI